MNLVDFANITDYKQLTDGIIHKIGDTNAGDETIPKRICQVKFWLQQAQKDRNIVAENKILTCLNHLELLEQSRQKCIMRDKFRDEFFRDYMIPLQNKLLKKFEPNIVDEESLCKAIYLITKLEILLRNNNYI